MTKPYVSYAGYTAALSIIVGFTVLLYLLFHHIITEITTDEIFAMIGLTFLLMLISEYIQHKRYNARHQIKVVFTKLTGSYIHLLKSTFFRFIALFIPFYIAYFIVQNHHYFTQNPSFDATRIMFDYFMTFFLYLSPLYIFLTLMFRGHRKYEFNDYAIITLIAMRSLYLSFTSQVKHTNYKNRRVKKVLLLYVVNFFFLTLMAQFVINEFTALQTHVTEAFSSETVYKTWFTQYKNHFNILFHVLFLIDVSIAIIGYSFASRWLDNRTKSVDGTFLGWFSALACYPPFNDFISKNFIFYNGLDTHNIITSDIAVSIILTLLIVLYTTYVWATVTLGFKFSNLTNRGIVTTGPYKIVRHPAYVSKNLAWIIDFTYVYTNIWATLAFFTWNGFYVLRALTEEKHLEKDIAYKNYMKTTPYRFIPKVI